MLDDEQQGRGPVGQVLDELLADGLGVEVSQGLATDVVAAEAVALHVGPLDPHLPQAIELAELAHTSERDAVVDLADLREFERVLGEQEDSAVVLEGDEGLAASDALAGKLGLVLGHLFRIDVIREGHDYSTGRRRPSMMD